MICYIFLLHSAVFCSACDVWKSNAELSVNRLYLSGGTHVTEFRELKEHRDLMSLHHHY